MAIIEVLASGMITDNQLFFNVLAEKRVYYIQIINAVFFKVTYLIMILIAQILAVIPVIQNESCINSNKGVT